MKELKEQRSLCFWQTPKNKSLMIKWFLFIVAFQFFIWNAFTLSFPRAPRYCDSSIKSFNEAGHYSYSFQHYRSPFFIRITSSSTLQSLWSLRESLQSSSYSNKLQNNNKNNLTHDATYVEHHAMIQKSNSNRLSSKEISYYNYHKTEERQSDYNLHLFWKTRKPFSTVQSIMDMILNPINNHSSPLIFSIQQTSSKNNSDHVHYANYTADDAFSHFFSPFYQPRLGKQNDFIIKDCNHTTTAPDKDKRIQPQADTKQRSFLISVSYRGNAFCGWQFQKQQQQQQLKQQHQNTIMLPSVQGLLISILDPILNPYFQYHQQNKTQEQDSPNSTISQTFPSSLKSNQNFNKNKARFDEQVPTNQYPKKKKKNQSHDYKPIDIRVCGRTDAGVNAFQQICRVRTIDNSDAIDSERIQDELNQHSFAVLNHDNDIRNDASIASSSASSSYPLLYCHQVKEVNSLFHPTFCATCRAYAYFLDVSSSSSEFSSLIGNQHISHNLQKSTSKSIPKPDFKREEHLHLNSELFDFTPNLQKHHVTILNEMLQCLEGRKLDYFAYSYGKVKTETTFCTLYRARASLVHVHNDIFKKTNQENHVVYEENSSHDKKIHLALCIELVGDRFLRRMVRKLVATALREVFEMDRNNPNQYFKDETKQKKKEFMPCTNDKYCGNHKKLKSPNDNGISNECQDVHKLVTLAESKQRELTAKAAPPDGLIFMGAEFDQDYTLSTSKYNE